jgi:hypothetical protein
MFLELEKISGLVFVPRKSRFGSECYNIKIPTQQRAPADRDNWQN